MAHPKTSKALTLSTLLVLAAAASAQPHDPPPLGGPPIHDRNAPGAGNTFGEPIPGEKSKATPRVRPRVFFDALRSLGSDAAPQRLHPTPEQHDELRAIVGDFMDEVRAFREQHQDHGAPPPRGERGPRPPRTLDERRADGPPPPPDGNRRDALGAERAGGANGPPPPPPRDGPPPADGLKEPRGERGPNPDGYYARIWEVLNDEQQAFLREQLDAAQRERMMQREVPIVREGVRKRLAEEDHALRDLVGLSREEIRARLRELPPEKRDEIISKLRERRDHASGPPKERRPEDRPPPPDMDKVDVPRAE